MSAPRPGTTQRPTRLGEWEIMGKIAGGGVASIYLGRAATPPHGAVALKVVRADLHADDHVARMAVDEARLLDRLSHPNIVETYEVGVDEAVGVRYIAMELLLGVTLASLHDALVHANGRLEPALVAWIAREIADALHYAHELADDKGASLAIVHRDVNPKNVFIGFDGRVKLFDFGMAHALGRTARTQPGIVKGTLPYLSPEQVMQLPIDRRVDVFSLGTTIWELLTRQRLFRKDTDAETLRAVQFGPIPDVRTIDRDIDERLAAIVRRALERNRDHRYATAAAVRDDLDAFLMTRHTEVAPAASRLGTLVDRLFPEERRKQSGWLKPRVSMPPPRASLTPPPMPVTTTPKPPKI